MGCRRNTKKTLTSLTLLTLFVVDVTSQSACPPEFAACQCFRNSANQYTVDCSNRRLGSLPSPVPPNTSSLLMPSNLITEIRVGTLNYLTELKDLYFQNNYISYIQTGAFAGSFKLQQIILANNYIKTVSRDVFSHLPLLSVIDLSNNRITTINRFAFFFLPSLVLVNLASNNLTCGCEEKLLKDFLDIKVGNLSLTYAQCTNFGNISITDVNQNMWATIPNCQEESLFRPLTSRQCYQCSDAKGMVDCQVADNLQQCYGEQDVCFIQKIYTVETHFGVWGGCQSYTTCLAFEALNYRDCTTEAPSKCFFCNSEQRFRRLDVANTTRVMRLLVLVTLSMDMTPGLSNNLTLEYKNFVNNIVIEFQNNLYQQKGSFLVEFIDLRSPRVTIALKVTASTIWFVKGWEVIEAIERKLLTIRYQGRVVEQVHVSKLTTDACASEIEQDQIYGTFAWDQTSTDTLAAIPCPFYTDGVASYATRYCDLTGVWSATNFTECSPESELSRQLISIAEQDVTPENVFEISSSISDASSSWESYQSIDVTLTVNVVEKILNTSLTSLDVIDNTIDTINNVLFIPTNTLAEAQDDKNTSSRLTSVIDDISENIDVTSDDFTAVKDNVAMYVSKIGVVNNFDGRTMLLGNRQGSFLNSESSFHTSEVEIGAGQSGMVMDATLFDGLTTTEKQNVHQLSMHALKDSKLYNTISPQKTTTVIDLPGNKTVNATRSINSHVISASVPGVLINDLQNPVKIVFRHLSAGVNAECVFWDVEDNVWTSDGCFVNETNEEATVCHCYHLTNFALLMDVYDSGGKLSKADLLALSIISYVGCGLSLLGVALTLFTYAYFKRIKKDNPSKILMNLCVAIGLVNLVFIVGVQNYTSDSMAGCKVVAVLLHYFLLSVMCWMLVEAFYMYLALIKIFNTHVAHFQLKSSLFGWGCPLIIVILTISINSTDNYGLQPGGICWLERIPFYIAFLGPVCVTMVLNLIVFTLVLRQIFRRSSKKLSKSDSNRGTAVRVRGAISLVILLGLTWLFAILAIGEYGKVFHYLFALTNTLQGLFIFVFYCVLKTEAQQAWKMCLPCFKKPYEQGRTTTATSKELEVKERLVSSESTFMHHHRTEGYSEADSSSKSTNSTDLTAKSKSNSESNDEPNIKDTEKNNSLPPKNTVFRGNWQMNISGARSTSIDA